MRMKLEIPYEKDVENWESIPDMVDCLGGMNMELEGTKIMQSHDECDEAGPSGESSSNEVPHLKRNQTYIKEELVIITLIALLILLKVVRDWFVTLRSLTLSVTKAVASSVSERHSVCYLAISKINVALQSWSQDKQL
ncbi:hypothetical protein SO802_010780 [Lithocarpus litseifolius]|uniref:Uncharacterized protein n=1 Tax=Lithocarpus litseifolius TaxID=425828 RepID=A0AAW2DI54_9ROSI